ncbi:MAG: hypothetical protein ACYDEI_00100 [Erysipelotrichaceae bacterium]
MRGKEMRPYIVYCTPYYAASAGIKVLHMLVHELRKAGQEAYCQTWPINPELMTPTIINDDLIFSLMQDRNGIAIYSENIEGNPFHAKENNIMRWLLSKPGLFGGQSAYNSSEHIYTYHKCLNVFVDKVVDTLTLPSINTELCYDPGYQRNIASYYLGKSEYNKEYGIDVSNMTEISKKSGMSYLDYIEVLKHSKVLYCFDKFTVVPYEAVLCGCPVVMIDDKNYNTNYLDLGKNGIGLPIKETYEGCFGLNGISIGIDGLDKAKETIKLFPEIYENEKIKFKKVLNEFIELSQNY